MEMRAQLFKYVNQQLVELRKLVDEVRADLRSAFNSKVQLEGSNLLLRLMGQFLARLDELGAVASDMSLDSVETNAKIGIHFLTQLPKLPRFTLTDTTQQAWFTKLYKCQELLEHISAITFAMREHVGVSGWYGIEERLLEVRCVAAAVKEEIELSINTLPATARANLGELGLIELPFDENFLTTLALQGKRKKKRRRKP